MADQGSRKIRIGGLLANSPYTVLGESYSAGSLYNKIRDTAEGTIMYVLQGGVLEFVTIDGNIERASR